MKFEIHFNRINMQRKSLKVWTVHTSKGCIQTKNIKCYVPLVTQFKPDGRQPRAKLLGKGDIYVDKDTVFIVDDTSLELLSDDDYFEVMSGKQYA